MTGDVGWTLEIFTSHRIYECNPTRFRRKNPSYPPIEKSTGMVVGLSRLTLRESSNSELMEPIFKAP